MKRCLVIANETVGGDGLVEKIRSRAEGEELVVHVVVPSLSPRETPEHGQDETVIGGGPTSTTTFADPEVGHKPSTSQTTGADTEGVERLGGDPSPARQSQIILTEVVERLEAVAAEVTGELGPADPVDAVTQALAAGSYDEVVVATPSPGASKLVGQDLDQRMSRAVDVPLTTVHAPRTDPRDAE